MLKKKKNHCIGFAGNQLASHLEVDSEILTLKPILLPRLLKRC